jgi:hypothetical protein
MTAHGRSKNGVSSFAYARPSTSFSVALRQGVDARHEAGHDEQNL